MIGRLIPETSGPTPAEVWLCLLRGSPHCGRPYATLAVGGSVFGQYVQYLRVGLYPIEKGLPVPYHVFIDMSKHTPIERSKREECEEAHDQGGDANRW
jgi:hypothetical protein